METAALLAWLKKKLKLITANVNIECSRRITVFPHSFFDFNFSNVNSNAQLHFSLYSNWPKYSVQFSTSNVKTWSSVLQRFDLSLELIIIICFFLSFHFFFFLIRT